MVKIRQSWKIKDTSKMHHQAWNKGKKTGLIPKSAFKKGNKAPVTAFKKGSAPWNKGIKTGIKSSSQFKKGQNSGSNNNNWHGGITDINDKIRNSLEIKLWKKAILERDNFTCQKTGIYGGDLVIHHINNFADFPEVRTSLENGVTLSKKSHLEFHKLYGFRNNTKEQLLEFLNSK